MTVVQVLLGLSDQHIVNLESEPTWYPVCPMDPNLPSLSLPVHYRNRHRVDHLLQKLKQKAQTSLANVKQPLPALSSMLSLLDIGPVERTSRQKNQVRRKNFEPQFIDLIESEIDNLPTEGTHFFEKLSTILSVLQKDSESVPEYKVQSAEVNNQKPPMGEGMHRKHSRPFNTIDSNGQLQSCSTDHEDGRPDNMKGTTLRKLSQTAHSSSQSDLILTKTGLTRKSNLSPENKVSNGQPPELEQLHTVGTQREDLDLQSAGNSRMLRRDSENSQTSKKCKVIDDCHGGDVRVSHPVHKSEKVSLHCISVTDVDKKQELSRKTSTLPSTGVSSTKSKSVVSNWSSDAPPPKPPREQRARSAGEIESIDHGEMFFVRSSFTPSPSSSYFDLNSGSSECLDSVGLMPSASSRHAGDTGKQFGAFLNQKGRLLSVTEGHKERVRLKHNVLGKEAMIRWKSVEDILSPAPLQQNTKYEKYIQLLIVFRLVEI